MFIGSDTETPGYPLDGLISQFVVWDTAISAQDVSSIFGETYPFNIPEPPGAGSDYNLLTTNTNQYLIITNGKLLAI